MSAHTPGWVYEGNGIIRDETGAIIAVTGTGHYEKGRLIAAAPALLEALEMVCSTGAHQHRNDCECLTEARAAIAAAKGETS